jgi:prophage DNA circulation protein
MTNQDRAIREKCTVLEVANRKLEKVITEKDYEILK